MANYFNLRKFAFDFNDPKSNWHEELDKANAGKNIGHGPQSRINSFMNDMGKKNISNLEQKDKDGKIEIKVAPMKATKLFRVLEEKGFSPSYVKDAKTRRVQLMIPYSLYAKLLADMEKNPQDYQGL